MNKLIERIKRIRFVTKLYRSKYPAYSTCGICRLPWKVCDPKSIMFNDFEGSFATCQYCWDKISLEQASKAYNELYITQCKQLNRVDKKQFIERRPLPVVLEYVKDEYIKTHKNK